MLGVFGIAEALHSHMPGAHGVIHAGQKIRVNKVVCVEYAHGVIAPGQHHVLHHLAQHVALAVYLALRGIQHGPGGLRGAGGAVRAVVGRYNNVKQFGRVVLAAQAVHQVCNNGLFVAGRRHTGKSGLGGCARHGAALFEAEQGHGAEIKHVEAKQDAARSYQPP